MGRDLIPCVASTDFGKTPVYMKAMADTYAVPAFEMASAFEHVFVEPTGKVNLLAGWEAGEITLVSPSSPVRNRS